MNRTPEPCFAGWVLGARLTFQIGQSDCDCFPSIFGKSATGLFTGSSPIRDLVHSSHERFPRFPERSNLGSPPPEAGVYPGELGQISGGIIRCNLLLNRSWLLWSDRVVLHFLADGGSDAGIALTSHCQVSFVPYYSLKIKRKKN